MLKRKIFGEVVSYLGNLNNNLEKEYVKMEFFNFVIVVL